MTDRSIAKLQVTFCISAPTGFLAKGWSLLGLKSAVFPIRRSLQVYPDEQTFSGSAGRSVSCPPRTSRITLGSPMLAWFALRSAQAPIQFHEDCPPA
jgi:hypothetical protein